MAVKLTFDANHTPIDPMFVLAKKSGKRLGVIQNVTEWNLSSKFNEADEISFIVYKESNGVLCSLWDEIKDFRLVWVKEWNKFFEIAVEIGDDEESTKKVTATSICESELSQVNNYNTQINTEDDIARADYVSPTVFYNSTNASISLLNRVIDKVPHYTIGHVDSSLVNIQRTFSFDDKSVYDCLMEIAEEVGCLFVFGGGIREDGAIDRTISAYDLQTVCGECGFRGDYTDSCPKCQSTNVTHGYGNDTPIFISKDNLASSISYSCNTDSVKNCFKLEAGDDLMTATIANCNPNGSAYIWYFNDDTRYDMSAGLQNALESYDTLYDSCYRTATWTVDFSAYNTIVSEYQIYDSSIVTHSNTVTGYSGIMQCIYDVIDLCTLIKTSLMPMYQLPETNASEQAAGLKTNIKMSTVAVTDIERISESTATNAVLAMAKSIVDARYQTKVKTSSLNGVAWSGTFAITNYSDEEDTAETAQISVTISDDYEEYVKQKIDKTLAKNDVSNVDISGLFKLSGTSFVAELKKYSIDYLSSIENCCQGCIDVLTEQGASSTESDVYTSVYLVYYEKLCAIQDEIARKQEQFNLVYGVYDSDGGLITNGVYTELSKHAGAVKDSLDTKKFLGDELWAELMSFRREDTYKNDNYISDGLSNDAIFKNALDFLSVANNELFKSATKQHTISSDIENLLVMHEFEPIVDYFEVGNWMRIEVDGVVYKLRLKSYDVSDGAIGVEFSDVTKKIGGVTDIDDILSSASNMSSSYSFVKRQASNGDESNKVITSWVNDGLSLTTARLVNSADTQSQVIDEHGILCREFVDEYDGFSDTQVRLLSRGLYVTNDGWKTSKAGIGKFYYIDPLTGDEVDSYGVIADTIVGNIILSSEVGVYNENNTISLDKNGLTITTNESSNANALTIKKSASSGTKELLSVDGNGDIVIGSGSNIIKVTSDGVQFTNASDLNTLISTAQSTADSAKSISEKIANGTYTGGTFIDGTSIYSPNIYGETVTINPKANSTSQNNTGTLVINSRGYRSSDGLSKSTKLTLSTEVSDISNTGISLIRSDSAIIIESKYSNSVGTYGAYIELDDSYLILSTNDTVKPIVLNSNVYTPGTIEADYRIIANDSIRFTGYKDGGLLYTDTIGDAHIVGKPSSKNCLLTQGTGAGSAPYWCDIDTMLDDSTAIMSKNLQSGWATISFKSTVTSVSVTFQTAFTSKPSVIVGQVFASTNITVYTEDVTTTGFTARLSGGFSSTGTRAFPWVAYGS